MSIKLRTRKNKDGSQSFYLDIYIKGKRNAEFLPIKILKNDPLRKQKKEMAEKIKAKREFDLASNVYGIQNPLTRDEDFLEYFDNKTKDQPYKSPKNKLKEFAKNRLINGTLPFNRIDEKFCEDYKEWLLTQISKNSASMYLSKLKAILNKALRENLIIKNPSKFVSIKMQETEKEFLTENEINKLYNTDCKNTELKRAFLFACFVGLRISDIKALTWGQIREGKLFLRQKKTKGLEYLPLSETALKILYSYEEENIIHLPDTKVFDIKVQKSQNIGNQLRKWAEKAEIKKYITFHTSRHTFTILGLTNGIDIYTMSKLLGHRSVATTQVYANIVDETVKNAVQKLPSLKLEQN